MNKYTGVIGVYNCQGAAWSNTERKNMFHPPILVQAIQERHENSLLKSEMDKLRDENRAMRETIKKASCPNCGFATSSRDATMTTEEQQIRIENARLKAEIEKLRATIGKYPTGSASPSSSCSAGNDQENRSSLEYYTGIFGLEKSRILELVNQAMEELTKMATAGEPLWVRSLETGREILNYGSEDLIKPPRFASYWAIPVTITGKKINQNDQQ
ncbi:hypothetical protein HHK36_004913 [Tetracentron sinense]|uniref:START domain-containing protein n=1 Tax=Tetracentron sinense TaxID=13715 RepID=A0A835DQA2_TETSI|nr:hypothetical protein HHK36_004913 [Tetracentron sinense]